MSSFPISAVTRHHDQLSDNGTYDTERLADLAGFLNQLPDPTRAVGADGATPSAPC
ncbi:hypothetical protein [Streptomyces sp. NPDC059161]|uniref:hypothetical protein n=1 Tax=unclassified Streptomyces TaxID=2593676 RepID=UPI00364720DA